MVGPPLALKIPAGELVCSQLGAPEEKTCSQRGGLGSSPLVPLTPLSSSGRSQPHGRCVTSLAFWQEDRRQGAGSKTSRAGSALGSCGFMFLLNLKVINVEGSTAKGIHKSS